MLLSACQINHANSDKENDYTFFVGTYTSGDSEGIYKYSLDKEGHFHNNGLLAKSDNPSFLALTADNKYLVTVNEIMNEEGNGSLESYLIHDDSLIFVSSFSSGGGHPCFVSISSDNFVLVANYTGGNVGLLEIDSKGILKGLDIQYHNGMGNTARQQGPHAHSAWFSPNKNDIISVDLGTNELWISQLDRANEKFNKQTLQKLSLEEGAGPRHLVFHPNGNWLYVINELNSSISLVKKIEGEYQQLNSISTLPFDYFGDNFCADIHISFDGNFIYASNRGHNSIAIFKVEPSDGSLVLVGHESVRGEWPRNFSLTPDGELLVVANEKSNSMVAFKRDKESGLLEFKSIIDALSPVCVLFE